MACERRSRSLLLVGSANHLLFRNERFHAQLAQRSKHQKRVLDEQVLDRDGSTKRVKVALALVQPRVACGCGGRRIQSRFIRHRDRYRLCRKMRCLVLAERRRSCGYRIVGVWLVE